MKFSELIFEMAAPRRFQTKEDLHKAVESFDDLPTGQKMQTAITILRTADRLGYVVKKQEILKYQKHHDYQKNRNKKQTEIESKSNNLQNHILTDESILHKGKTLYRIKSKDGVLGGYVESIDNLDSSNGAWVNHDAKVYGSAKIEHKSEVSGNAKVYGNAIVSGNAKVSGKAEVFGNASLIHSSSVSGNAKVYDNAIMIDNSKVTDNAEIFGNAKLWNHSKVYENAKVYGDVEVHASSKVYGNAKVSGKARINYTAEVSGDAEVTDNVWVDGIVRGDAKVSGNQHVKIKDVFE